MTELPKGQGRVDDLDLADEREYAWLLVRSDTLLDTLLDAWRALPTNEGGRDPATPAEEPG